MPMERIHMENASIDKSGEIRVLRNSEELNPDMDLLPYENIEIHSSEAQGFIGQHDSMLERCFEDRKREKKAESFVGSGNNALVLTNFTDNSGREFCTKMSWRNLSVAYKFRPKSKELDLPDRLKGLRKTEEYFEIIKKKKRDLIGKEIDFKTQNPLEREALVTMYVHAHFKDVGLERHIPAVLASIKYHNEEDGSTENIAHYSVIEDVDAMHLEFIDGVTIEDLVLNNPENMSERLDPEKFEKTIRKIFEILHKISVTHGDVSIRNIMLRKDTLEPVLIDFGAAQFYGINRKISSHEIEADISGIEQVIRLLQKFKKNPKETSEELRVKYTDYS